MQNTISSLGSCVRIKYAKNSPIRKAKKKNKIASENLLYHFEWYISFNIAKDGKLKWMRHNWNKMVGLKIITI